MPESHLLAIPLPHGRTGDTGHLSVYFAPRLRSAARLGAYPEWEHWADTVTGLDIDVIVDGVTQTSPPRVAPLAEPAVWDAVFDRKTPVAAHRATDWQPLAENDLLVGPGGDFSEAVLRLYADVATSFATAPPPGDTVGGLDAADVLTSPGAVAARRYIAPMEGERIDEARDPELDFHAYVSILGHHPELLRLLGLVVELEVDLPSSPGRVRVGTNWDNGLDRRAVEFVMRTTPDFWARPNPIPALNEQEDGFQVLTRGKPDLDAIITILDTGSTADRLRDLEQRLPGRTGNLPSLTTRALTLVQKDLVPAFMNRTKRQNEIEADIEDWLSPQPPNEPVELFAEDVSRGHRIDVFQPKSPELGWRSLFERQTDDDGYRFPADPALDRVPESDEGWTSLKLATELVENLPEPNDDTNEPHVPFATRRIDDQLYRWDGWSGAVRPPGGTVDGATGGLMPEQPTAPPVDQPVQFATSYEAVPGSLPRLRFGVGYLMRARSVDLSGTSRSIDTKEPASALPPLETFGRLEPIAAPFLVRRRNRPFPGVGDAVGTVVLRSDFDVDDADVPADERLMFPGQVGQDLCELHGEPVGGVDVDSYRELAQRDGHAPHDPWTTDPVTGEPVADGALRQPVDYLADPMVGRLRAAHGGLGSVDLVDLPGRWPALSSSRIEVVAGDRATTVSPDADTELRVAVAKADIDTVALSYAPTDGRVDQFGLWHQIDPEARQDLRELVEDGGHWMFSAGVPLTVVHAVRRPLIAPSVTRWEQSREERSTGVTFTSELGVDRRSTGRVNLRARWIDLVDDLRAPGPEPRAGGAAFGGFTTPRDSTVPPTFQIEDHRAELGDTRRHEATIEVEAISFFSDYFTEERAVTMRRGEVLVDDRGFAPGSVSVTLADGTAAVEGIDYRLSNQLGTISDAPSRRIRAGDTVTIRWIPTVSRTSREHEPFVVVFPSTKVPPPPVVDDVVPAFARHRTLGGDDGTPRGQVVHHDGNVVRVYLSRPWNVSGDGEQLAVLVERVPGDVPAASCLGRDPIVGGTTTPLDSSMLTRATSVVPSEDGVHDLALHEVTYDTVSRRWFADIAIDTDMYRPFVRFSLARYQDDSIDGCRASTAIASEPLRLGVRRTVTVTDGGAGEAEVVVTGPDHAGMISDGAGDEPLVNEVVVIHQRADKTIKDEDLRWRTDVSTTVLDRISDGGSTTWSATVPVPSEDAPARLVVEEREPALVGGATPAIDRQAIYADTVDLAVHAPQGNGASPSPAR